MQKNVQMLLKTHWLKFVHVDVVDVAHPGLRAHGLVDAFDIHPDPSYDAAGVPGAVQQR